MSPRILPLCALAPLLLPAGHRGQESGCPDVSPDPEKAEDLRYKVRGTRCEGFYRSKVGGEEAPMLSFYESFPREGELPDQLALSWTAPEALPVSLQARAFGDYYRMDAQAGAAENAFVWPTDVIRRAKLDLESIGVVCLARDGRGEAGTYLPLRVGATAERSADLVAEFVPRERLKFAWYFLYEVDGDGNMRGKPLLQEDIDLDGRGLGWADTPVPVEVSMADRPAGYYRILFRADVRGRNKQVSSPVDFYHDGGLPPAEPPVEPGR